MVMALARAVVYLPKVSDGRMGTTTLPKLLLDIPCKAKLGANSHIQ
jgi:hypothetical protein